MPRGFMGWPRNGAFGLESQRESAEVKATIQRFELAGWTVAHRGILDAGPDGVYAATVVKHGMQVSITVNNNDWGVQGSFELAGQP